MKYSIVVLWFALCGSIYSEEKESVISRGAFVGTWRNEYREIGTGVLLTAGHTVYMANGIFYAASIYYLPNGGVVPVLYSGEWSFDGKNLLLAGKNSSDHARVPVGLEIKVKVLELSDKHYSYLMPDGKVYREYRLK